MDFQGQAGRQGSVSDVSDVSIGDATAKRVVAVMPSQKRECYLCAFLSHLLTSFTHLFAVLTMKEAARRNNVVCRVKTHKLLVRFKDRSPLIPANVQEQRARPRTPRYSKEEKNVSG